MSCGKVSVIVLALIICVSGESVNRKLCKNLDTNWCNVHSVDIEPCTGSPRFCRLKTGKPYMINVDFTPNFFSPNLELVMLIDEMNNDSFIKEVKLNDDCGNHRNCEVMSGERRNLTAHFSLDKSYSAELDIYCCSLLQNDLHNELSLTLRIQRCLMILGILSLDHLDEIPAMAPSLWLLIRNRGQERICGFRVDVR